MKLLLADCRSQLAPEVLPADSSQVTNWINAVCQHFYLVGKWAGTTVRWKGTSAGVSFAIYYDCNNQAYVTLPRGILSLLAAGYGATTPGQPPSYKVRFSNAPIQGPWHEFGNGNYGVGDTVWGRGIFDAGDGWTTFRDIEAPSYLQVVTETAEATGATMLFRGLDQNQNEIYSGTGSSTTQGVTLDISTGLTTQTTQQFSKAPSLVQKPVTYGPVSLNAVNVATGAVTLIAIYAPGETSPGFRRYKLGGPMTSSNGVIPYTTMHAMTKRRFVPAVANADEVIPANLQAIELGMMGRRYDLAGDTNTADEYWGEALALLNAELNEHNGGALPRIVWQPGSNPAGMPWIG